jgi:uncharacterized RDD family membrane protein YckC
MKCPKCGYLGFERVERCRNCGYDFSLASVITLPELPIRNQTDDHDEIDDLSLVDAASASAGAAPRDGVHDVERASQGASLPFRTDELPLISKPSAPRAPLAVRRATPEVPRVRPAEPARAPLLDLSLAIEESDAFQPTSLTPGERAQTARWAEPEEEELVETAPVGSRIVAAGLDIGVLLVVDLVVVYLTLRICGLALGDAYVLPKAPLGTFLALQNAGYFVAFTAGGQTLGKMATGIRVVSALPPHTAIGFENALLRTLMWAVLVVPAGLGFVTALFNRDRCGLHDRVAGTRVIRASA